MFKYVRFTKVTDDVTVYEFRGESEDVKVNHFDIDIVSIESEDENSIDELIANQDEKIACEEVSKEEFESLIKTTSQYSRILEVVEQKFTQMLVPISKEYPLEERESWGLQIEEANAYMKSNNDVDAPYLAALALDEESTTLDFAQSVISKHAAYKNLHLSALSEKRRFKRELLASIGV